MKFRRKNRSILFRGMVLSIALAFTVLCFPVNQIVAHAEGMTNFIDYTYMTLGTKREQVLTTVNTGRVYEVRNAYIGGDKNRAIGSNITDKALADKVTLKTSKITVKYSSKVLGEVKDGAAYDANGTVITDNSGAVRVSAGKVEFDAKLLGSYTVTYSYTYSIKKNVGGVEKDVEYTNSYDMTVTSELTDADINLGKNEKVFLPKDLDLKLAKKGDSYKDLYIPMPKIVGDNGEDVDTSSENTDFEFITARKDDSGNSIIGRKKQQLLIEVSTNSSSTKVPVSGNATDGFYISGDVFGNTDFGAGKYKITYSYYEDGQFIASTSPENEIQVHKVDENDSYSYYKDYSLRLKLDSDFVSNGKTGRESNLPTASGLTSTSTTPKSEKVDIYYTVKVYHKTSSTSYKLIDADKYNASVAEGEEKIVNEDGTLVDPTKFKPLDDGYYSFVYEAYDFYYDWSNPSASSNRNHYYKTDLGQYEFQNIKDEDDPEPTLYVATKDGHLDDVDATKTMATRVVPESVIVYAIGMDDNVSKVGDEGVVLTRRISTDDPQAPSITLSSKDERDYSAYNLVFNYKKNADSVGRDGLKTNNYLIRKAMEKESDYATNGDSEAWTLNWLAENKYLIVVDNANYERLYENFKNESVFDETVTDKESALKWFKSDAALEKGFAYINSDKTFGSAASVSGGMGVGQYYVHYIAKDAAGNEKDISRPLYVRDYEDRESPKIEFQTSLNDNYWPDDKITFNAPTASDNFDSEFVVNVMYRYLDKDGEVIDVYDKDSNLTSKNDLSELWQDLGTDPDLDSTRDDNNKLITEKYSKYHEDRSTGTPTRPNDGYVDITDLKASSYTIDLSEVEGAEKIQIIAYTYDDSGNAMLYGQEIGINNIQDEYQPVLLEDGVDSVEENFQDKYEQGAIIALPKVIVADDAVDYMTTDVKVDLIEDGKRYARSVRETTVDRDNQEGIGMFTVNAGEFVASKDGQYQASIAVKDFNNNTIVVFVNYEVSPRASVEKPVINSTLTSQTVQLDDEKTIEIPTPTVNFDLGDSTTYDVKDENPSATYIVRGLNADGKATNWTTNNKEATKGKFTPSAKGQYDIQYSVKVEAYDRNKFTFVKSSFAYDDTTDAVTLTKGGYYTNNTLGAGTQITAGATGEYRFKTGSGDTAKYTVVKNVDGEFKFYNSNKNYTYEEDKNVKQTELADTTLQTVDFTEWKQDFRVYNLTSDIYTITVDDTIGPKLIKYDYSDQEQMSVEEFKNNGGIKIYGIQATDKAGIDAEASSIKLSWKRANGTAAGDVNSTIYQNINGKNTAFQDVITYNTSASNLDGTYTITYEVYDKNGNKATENTTYTISVGDHEAPTVKVLSDIFKTSYTLKDKITLDTKEDIKVFDNKSMPEDTTYKIKLINTSKNNEEVEYKKSEDGRYYYFKSFEEYGEGNYTLSIEVEDAVGHVTVNDETKFTVASKTKDSKETYKVVGTVLIVISVLVLAGVIIYFIVSKVKLDKELKK